MKVIRFALLVAFLTSSLWAIPVNTYAKVSSAKPFSGERLFAVLDSLGMGANWMEWEPEGIKDPSVEKVLSAVGATPEMVWVVSERVKPLLAVLVAEGNGEKLLFYEIPKLDASPVPLSLKDVLNPDVVFRDYRQITQNLFIHRDKESLKVEVAEKRIRFTYSNPDKDVLYFDPDFSKKTFVEKRALVRDFKDYLKYEYSLMLRAFVQSTHGIFNWQPWHWYMPEWNGVYFIKDSEIEAILAKGTAPSFFSIFKGVTATKVMVEFKASGNGFAELVISMP